MYVYVCIYCIYMCKYRCVCIATQTFICNFGLICPRTVKHLKIILPVGLWQHGENLSALN